MVGLAQTLTNGTPAVVRTETLIDAGIVDIRNVIGCLLTIFEPVPDDPTRPAPNEKPRPSH